jgi:hypothetical protein
MPPNFRIISASSEALRLDVTATVIPCKDMKQSCNLWIIKTWAYTWKVQFSSIIILLNILIKFDYWQINGSLNCIT